ncbi:MAG TPA: protein phosphatase 2C domain-containing protein [Wenzhouxiangella sp.]|nr:protein phosphatase 2C domain-containing protein [Wenzhouxiangella sp.]
MNSNNNRKGRSASASHAGHVRPDNQDAVLADDGLGLWLVADGMGGHAGGSCASSIAIDTIRASVARGLGLNDALGRAHERIRLEQQRRPGYSGMGTTAVVLRESNSRYEIGWSGDSRAYLYSAAGGSLTRLTRDHNIAGSLVAAGALSVEEAARHPQRNVLTSCLGLSGGQSPRVDHVEGAWRPGDVIILCTDGLSGELDDGEIEKIIGAVPASDPAGMVEALVSAALEAGGHDNISVIAVAAPATARQHARTSLRRRLSDLVKKRRAS